MRNGAAARLPFSKRRIYIHKGTPRTSSRVRTRFAPPPMHCPRPISDTRCPFYNTDPPSPPEILHSPNAHTKHNHNRLPCMMSHTIRHTLLDCNFECRPVFPHAYTCSSERGLISNRRRKLNFGSHRTCSRIKFLGAILTVRCDNIWTRRAILLI